VHGRHGLRGELKVEPLTDYPQRFERGAALWAGERTYTILGARMHQKALLLELEGIDTVEAAEAMRGLMLEVPEGELAPLPEGAYYRFQIVGMDVVDTGGRSLGRVAEVLDTGANDVYIVRGDEGELLIPAIDAVIKEVDVARGRMVVELLPGMERRTADG